jgi:hypothetical protein
MLQMSLMMKSLKRKSKNNCTAQTFSLDRFLSQHKIYMQHVRNFTALACTLVQQHSKFTSIPVNTDPSKARSLASWSNTDAPAQSTTDWTTGHCLLCASKLCFAQKNAAAVRSRNIKTAWNRLIFFYFTH